MNCSGVWRSGSEGAEVCFTYALCYRFDWPIAGNPGFREHSWLSDAISVARVFGRSQDQPRAQAHQATLAAELVSMRALVGGRARRLRVCTRCLKAGKVTKVI